MCRACGRLTGECYCGGGGGGGVCSSSFGKS